MSHFLGLTPMVCTPNKSLFFPHIRVAYSAYRSPAQQVAPQQGLCKTDFGDLALSFQTEKEPSRRFYGYRRFTDIRPNSRPETFFSKRGPQKMPRTSKLRIPEKRCGVACSKSEKEREGLGNRYRRITAKLL